LFTDLLEHDILIRDVGIDHHLRVTAGTEEEISFSWRRSVDFPGDKFP